MPASSNNTLIRLMRGPAQASEYWVPDEGEPLLDLDTGTLNYGDAKTLGGLPVNTCTSRDMPTPADLDKAIVWGRYFLNGEISPAPDGVSKTGRFFLIVQSQDLGTAEIWQELQVLDGLFATKAFTRVTLDKGITWSSWKDISGKSFTNEGSGAKEGDGNLNNYIYSSEAYVDNIVNGPEGTNGCDGFLFTMRKNSQSPYIYQKLILVGCPDYAGRTFCRYSVNANQSWGAPGFNWKEI